MDGLLESLTLSQRNTRCISYYGRLMSSRRHVDKLHRLSNRLKPTTETQQNNLTETTKPLSLTRLALIISGQAYRGSAREVPTYSYHTLRDPISLRRHAQIRASNSLVQQVIMPFEASGCRVDLFLTVYDTLNPELRDELTRLYSPRVLAVTTVHERGSSQVCRNCEVLISFTPRLCE